MANALTLTAASQPAASTGVGGLKTGGNSNGINSAAWTYAGGAGALDTIANAELLKGVDTRSRLYTFLTKVYADQAAVDSDMAALGVVTYANGGSNFLFLANAGAVTATFTCVAATGMLRVSMAHTTAR
jgi:hypothetical protein